MAYRFSAMQVNLKGYYKRFPVNKLRKSQVFNEVGTCYKLQKEI